MAEDTAWQWASTEEMLDITKKKKKVLYLTPILIPSPYKILSHISPSLIS